MVGNELRASWKNKLKSVWTFNFSNHFPNLLINVPFHTHVYMMEYTAWNFRTRERRGAKIGRTNKKKKKEKKRTRFELVRVDDPLLSRIDFRPIARNNEKVWK